MIDRRTLLRGLALAPALALGGCAARGAAPAWRLGYGPAAFEVTARAALVWLRLQERGWLHLEYATAADFAGAARTPAVDATDTSDHTVTLALDGLAPGREYFYRAVVRHRGHVRLTAG